MDALSEAKVQEHEPHGWFIEMDLYAVKNGEKIPGWWMNCSCGWRGWIVDDPERPPKETYTGRV